MKCTKYILHALNFRYDNLSALGITVKVFTTYCYTVHPTLEWYYKRMNKGKTMLLLTL